MLLLRITAILLAAATVGGELLRSWGTGRPVLLVAEDFLVAALLVAGALAMQRDTIGRRAFFAVAWGAAAGQFYASLATKLAQPAVADPGNFRTDVLTWLIATALIISIVGAVASFALPRIKSIPREHHE